MAKCVPSRALVDCPGHVFVTPRCRCVTEVNQRFLVGGAQFKCKVVDKVTACSTRRALHTPNPVCCVVALHLTHLFPAGWC
jgi:hypothetical protein